MTLYRKYRPQKIEELDLEDIRKKLSLVMSSGHTPHAFLFAGPKGTGKTSAARIVAKLINCEKVGKKRLGVSGADRFGQKFEPCNKCEACISITAGNNLDVLEIDAASNRGIDEIRDLRDKIKLAPSGSLFKVYIIDEVHMLTTEAFNALLKTLEEPPPHAIFILATTEPEKLLPTIISRCSLFYFKKASRGEIVHSLERVVKGEKLKIDKEKEYLEAIADVSEGSFRDGVKILEQAISENAHDLGALSKIIGEQSGVLVENLLQLLAQKDAKGALETIHKAGNKGTNMKLLTAEVLNHLHKLLLIKFGVGEKSADKELKFEVSDINILIKLFSRAFGEFRLTAIPELPLELVIVEWCEKKGGA